MNSKSIHKFYIPTNEEDAGINAGIASDPDTYELSDESIDNLQPFKPLVTIPLSPSVLDAFVSTGAGWQTRIDDALKEWLSAHHNVIPTSGN